MFVKADTATATAGKVTFSVRNTGAMMHGFAVAPAPVKAPGGTLDASAFVARSKELAPGSGGVVTADLKPGSYELVCFLAGHYAAGQRMAFTVR